MDQEVKTRPAQAGATDTSGMGTTIQPLGLEAGDADRAIASGQSFRLSQFVTEQITGWDGLTEGERQDQEQQEAEDARRLQEYIEENERQFQSMMNDLRERDAQVLEQMKKMEESTFHLDGDKKKAVFVDQFGRFVDANGNLLEGDAKKQAQDALEQGVHFEKWEDFEKSKKQHEEYLRRMEEAERKHAEHKRAIGEAVDRGDMGAAWSEAQKDRIRIETAKDKLAIVNEVNASNVSVNTKEVKDASRSTDIAELDGLFDESPSGTSDHGAAVTTRNTSLAKQADPVPGQLALTPEFTASANPPPRTDTPAPVIGQKNTATIAGPVAV